MLTQGEGRSLRGSRSGWRRKGIRSDSRIVSLWGLVSRSVPLVMCRYWNSIAVGLSVQEIVLCRGKLVSKDDSSKSEIAERTVVVRNQSMLKTHLFWNSVLAIIRLCWKPYLVIIKNGNASCGKNMWCGSVVCFWRSLSKVSLCRYSGPTVSSSLLYL